MPLILLGQPEADDVDAGFQYIAGEVRAGRPGIFLGRKSDAFCLLMASPKKFEVSGGIAIGADLSTAQLAAFRDRIMHLLHGQKVVDRLRGL
jgi:hypothetical protein